MTSRFAPASIGGREYGLSLRTVHFAAGQTDEGLDLAQPIVVEGLDLDLAANLTERGFTAEEALACMLRQNMTAAAAPTAEDVAAELKEALKVLADWWG